MLLCSVCTEAGFTGKNTSAFECRGCNQVYGHKRFDIKELRLHMITNCVERVRAKPLCIECEPIRCAQCSHVQPRRDFPPRMIANNKTRGGMLLCSVCSEAGFSGKNTKAFECRGCNQVYGHKRFDAKELRLHMIKNCVDRVRAKPLCNDCAQKVKLLRAEVNKSGRRCRCNGTPNHKDSCPFGLPRRGLWWPGGELRTVSADAKQLLDRANMQWWKDLHIPSGI